eukprot:Nk52_evm53s255 gene=Nk52_evmTU53s255
MPATSEENQQSGRTPVEGEVVEGTTENISTTSTDASSTPEGVANFPANKEEVLASALAVLKAEELQLLMKDYSESIETRKAYWSVQDYVLSLAQSSEMSKVIKTTVKKHRNKSFIDWNKNESEESPSIRRKLGKDLDAEDRSLLDSLREITEEEEILFTDYLGGAAPYPKPAAEGVRERKVTTELPKFSLAHPDPRRWFRDMREDCEDANKIGERALRPIIRHMDEESHTRVDLSIFANGGLTSGLTLDSFEKWFVKTFNDSDKKSNARTEAKQYNPVGKTLRTILSALFKLFARAGTLLPEEDACMILRAKCPKDVLARVTNGSANNLRRLASEILEGENFLFPNRSRVITKDLIDWKDIPSLDPQLKRAAGAPNYTGDD